MTYVSATATHPTHALFDCQGKKNRVVTGRGGGVNIYVNLGNSDKYRQLVGVNRSSTA